jgi:hypothetical protein
MSSHNDSFASSGTSPTPDFLCENHSSVFLLRPISPAAFDWMKNTSPLTDSPLETPSLWSRGMSGQS